MFLKLKTKTCPSNLLIAPVIKIFNEGNDMSSSGNGQEQYQDQQPAIVMKGGENNSLTSVSSNSPATSFSSHPLGPSQSAFFRL